MQGTEYLLDKETKAHDATKQVLADTRVELAQTEVSSSLFRQFIRRRCAYECVSAYVCVCVCV
jgi:hypothetical protein